MHDHGRERGSVLMLVPAAVLVLVILGAIAVDFSVAFLGQRELTSAAGAAANDAATAISESAFYQGGDGAGAGTVRVDDDQSRRVVDKVVDASGSQVCVVLRGRVSYVFAKAVPGMPDGATVEGRATATAVTGPAGSRVAPRPPC